MGKPQRILVVSDLHAPYHDKRAWSLLLKTIRALRPERIVIIGDFADCYAVSAHLKSMARRLSFELEIEAVNGALDELQRAAGLKCVITFCEGNHETRITRYCQTNAPELGGLDGLQFPSMTRLRDRGIAFVPYRRHVWIGKCAFTHDLGRAGANAARQTVVDFGGNIVIGHTHRGGIAYQGETRGRSHFCLNVGWLGDLELIDYVHLAKAKRDWQHGFGWIDQDAAGNSWAQFIPIVGGAVKVEGERIAA